MVLKQFLQKLSPHIFNDLSKVDQTEEGLINWCPECEITLPDNRVYTMKKHMIIHDKRTDIQKMKQAYLSSFLYPITILGILFVSLYGVTIITTMYSEYIDDADGYTIANQCSDTLHNLKAQIYENKKFDSQNIDALQYLLETCELRFYYGDIYNTPKESIYLNDKGTYDSIIKELERTKYKR